MGRKSYPLAEAGCVFLVEEIKRSQADVRNFLLIERDFGKRYGVARDGTFATGIVADAAPPSAKDAPAAPNMFRAALPRLRFEARFVCAIAGSSDAREQIPQ